MQFVLKILFFTLLSASAFGQDRRHSINTVISGHSDDIAIEFIGNYALSNRWDLNLGFGSTGLPDVSLLDFKVGATAVKEEYNGTPVAIGFFAGQTQISTTDRFDLDPEDQRFLFIEGRFGVGPIGVGYRFNFMKSTDGLALGHTHIKTATVYPYMTACWSI